MSDKELLLSELRETRQKYEEVREKIASKVRDSFEQIEKSQQFWATEFEKFAESELS